MRKWARLTKEDGVAVDANMDHVAYMFRDRDLTFLTLAYAKAETSCLLVVKETVDKIHQTAAMG
jgi:hypothetical protein